MCAREEFLLKYGISISVHIKSKGFSFGVFYFDFIDVVIVNFFVFIQKFFLSWLIQIPLGNEAWHFMKKNSLNISRVSMIFFRNKKKEKNVLESFVSFLVK